jgi:predicted Zn-dependent protease
MASATASEGGIAVPTAEVQALYDRHRYLDAFAASADYWKAGPDLRDLTTDHLILGGRLAGRLGAPRLARWLFRTAVERDPGSPLVRYFARYVKIRGRTVLDELRDFEDQPDIGGEDPALRAAWYASFALTWAGLRDFQRAHECLATAHSLSEDDAWVLSCECGVLGLADRWADALAAAERALAVDPDSPFAAVGRGAGLLNLGRPEESARTLSAAAENGQSFELAGHAAWHQCALAETLDEPERRSALEQGRLLLDRACALAPLADREARQGLSRARLDIASLCDDYAEIERWTEEVRSPFHRQVLANLRQNPAGRRIHLLYRRAVQKHDACLPTSLAMALSANGPEMSIDEMASAITFGGTAQWAAVDWLRERGYYVRSFAVTPEVSRALIHNRMAFVVNWQTDERGHSVAIVGLDERAQTLIVHDPATFRSTEYLLGILDAARSPLGIPGIAVVPQERAADLDALLPPEAEIIEGAQSLQRALVTQGPAAARAIAADLTERFPHHAGARHLGAVQLLADGHIGLALTELHALLVQFPDAPDLRTNVLGAYQALRNTARLRLVLKDIVEEGLLPGLTAEQTWIRPPDRYVFGYADLLRLSSATRAEATRLLHSLLRRQPASAGAWHTLGDLLSHTSDRAGAALCLRLASCLDPSDEHYATAHAGALGVLGRPGEGLSWLELRARTAGESPRGAGAWISWASALEDHGDPERALAACREALERHPQSPEFLGFAVPFFARMGQWETSVDCLEALRSSANPAAFREAATQFHLMRGEWADAIEHAESWLRDSPHAMNARRALLGLLALGHGPDAPVERARAWMQGNPGHEDLEDAYGAALDRAGGPLWKKCAIFRRRVRRNPEDAAAWLELTNTALDGYAAAGEQRRARLAPRIEALLAECERTAAGSVPTLRAQAAWSEVRGDWTVGVSKSLDILERDPASTDAVYRAWRCSARFSDAERRRVWNEIRPRLLGAQGPLSSARDMMALLVQRFGVSETERELEQWRLARPDDPNVLEAAFDLLLDHGRGRADAERALALFAAAAGRFPHHLGLRFSLASAYRATGQGAAAESVLLDIGRRHPGNSAAKIQLAWTKVHGGDAGAGCRLLESAEASEPQNPEVLAARAVILHQNQRVGEARTAIAQGLTRMGKSVAWRTRAVDLLMDWGTVEEALAAAQHGVAVYPRNAALWLLLGRTMGQLRRQFTVKEIESCLRTSLRLDASLFESADLLACCLADRECYDEALRVLQAIEVRMADPSPARGRLAWIEHRRTQGARGLDALAAAVAAAPWYEWGWLVLADWLEEDRDWERARLLFARVPGQLSHSLRFRQRRLLLLGKAGGDVARLNAEWNALIQDHPDNEDLRTARSGWLREDEPASSVSEASATSGIPPWAWGALAWMAISLLRSCSGLP